MEVNHRCETCRSEFKDIAYYKKHLKTKRHIWRLSSSVIIPNISCICGKLYTFQQSLYVHHKKCTKYINSKTAPAYSSIITVSETVLLQLQTEKYEMREKLISYEKKQEEQEKKEKEREKQHEEMKAQITMLMERNATSNTNSHNKTNNTNSHNNQNINININAFGNEKTDYIDEKAFITCISQVYKSIPYLLEQMHFNPNHPENHNIKINNKKLPYASVMGDNQKWKTVDRKGAIESMVQKGYNLLDEKYEENKDKFSPIKQQNFEGFQTKFEADDKDLVRQLKSEVEIMVLNGA
jgi:hypothetical protein